MPTFLTRLRSLRLARSKTASDGRTPTEPARKEARRDAHTSVGDASPESLSRNVELDSKIYPDLSALFASVEDALKSHERVAEAQEVQLYDESDSEKDYGNEQARPGQHAMNDSALYASYGSGLATEWSTFGQDDTPCPQVPRTTHIVNNKMDNNDRAIAANVRSSSTDAVLSWSPKPIGSSESLRRTTNISYSSPALYPSPEVQQQNTETSVYYSPTAATFGFPTPPHFDPFEFPSLPAPAFHSTPKTSNSSRSHSLPRRGPKASGRSRIPRLSSRPSRMKRTKSDLPRTSRRHASTPVIEGPEPKRTSIRTSVSVSKIPVRRRKSAEWNARAATAGVTADPEQTTEFGWPAEVSREILRLSLGDEALLHMHGGQVDTKTRSADANLKRGGPRVSHGHKLNDRLIIRPSVSEHRLSSAHLDHSSTLPPSSSTSSAPGRSYRPQTTATQVNSTPSAPSVADPKNTKSQSQPSSGDHALDTTKSDSEEMGATGVLAPHHNRAENENKIDWESAELQEFISREEGRGDSSGDALRPPTTPMKKSESESTYQTAGSSSYLQAPSLSVIAPTPRSSPGGSRHNSGGLPDTTSGLQVPTPPPQTAKGKGKRKVDESEDGGPTPPDAQALQKKLDRAADEGRRNNSNASRVPSSFQSMQSQKSRKRVRLSPPMATPDHSRPGSTVPQHLGSVSSRGSSRSPLPHSDSKGVPPRPPSRTSRTSRAMSAAPSGASSVAFPGRRSLSQASIPISAIITPRAPSVSVDRLSSFHMRDPRRPPPRREVGWTLRLSSSDERGSPFAAWAFWFGFPLPLLWWMASFWRIPQTRMVGTDTEKAVVVDDPFYEREARTWRLRCRVASVVFFFTYVPVIVLLVVFV